MTWLFNRTGGSALLAGFLFHAAINAWNGVVFASATLSGAKDVLDNQLLAVYIVITVVAAALVILGTRGRLGMDSIAALSPEAVVD